MNRPLMSYIIPAYNSEKTIGRALRSIYKNALDYEVVVVDDGSCDNTVDAANRYKNKIPNLLIISKENGGVSSARNVGLEKARGEYVLFLDSDDVITRNIRDVECIARTLKYDVVKCNYSAQRRVKFLYTDVVSFGEKNEGEMSIDYLRKSILLTSYCNTACGQIVRRRAIKGVKFNEKYIMAEDLDFNLRIYDCMKNIYYLSKPIIKYMYNKNSATRKVNYQCLLQQLLDEIEVYGKFNEYYKRWRIDLDPNEMQHHIDNICGYIINKKKEYAKDLESIYRDKWRSKT